MLLNCYNLPESAPSILIVTLFHLKALQEEGAHLIGDASINIYKEFMALNENMNSKVSQNIPSDSNQIVRENDQPEYVNIGVSNNSIASILHRSNGTSESSAVDPEMKISNIDSCGERMSGDDYFYGMLEFDDKTETNNKRDFKQEPEALNNGDKTKVSLPNYIESNGSIISNDSNADSTLSTSSYDEQFIEVNAKYTSEDGPTVDDFEASHSGNTSENLECLTPITDDDGRDEPRDEELTEDDATYETILMVGNHAHRVQSYDFSLAEQNLTEQGAVAHDSEETLSDQAAEVLEVSLPGTSLPDGHEPVFFDKNKEYYSEVEPDQDCIDTNIISDDDHTYEEIDLRRRNSEKNDILSENDVIHDNSDCLLPHKINAVNTINGSEQLANDNNSDALIETFVSKLEEYSNCSSDEEEATPEELNEHIRSIEFKPGTRPDDIPEDFGETNDKASEVNEGSNIIFHDPINLDVKKSNSSCLNDLVEAVNLSYEHEGETTVTDEKRDSAVEPTDYQYESDDVLYENIDLHPNNNGKFSGENSNYVGHRRPNSPNLMAKLNSSTEFVNLLKQKKSVRFCDLIDEKIIMNNISPSNSEEEEKEQANGPFIEPEQNDEEIDEPTEKISETNPHSNDVNEVDENAIKTIRTTDVGDDLQNTECTKTEPDVPFFTVHKKRSEPNIPFNNIRDSEKGER